MKDFFISYNQADRQWAEWIAWELEEAGYFIIIQAWDFRPGNNFILEMDKAAKESERTIAVLSPDFLKSVFTKPEWAAAFVKDPTGMDGKLLPVRVKECQPDGLLAAIGYIDVFGLKEEEAAKITLLEGVKLERAKPAQAPTFPGMAKRIIKAAPRFPGALPPVWNVPFQQNPFFSGRDQTLAELQGALTSGEPTAWKQALWGMGGAGKTQVAVEYTYRHKADYEVVWWLRSEEHTTLSADYAALATDLDLPEKDLKEQSEVVKAARRWLEHNPGWLLIFDNAQEPKDLKDYLPKGGGGHVIITSRNPEWGSHAKRLEVKVFDRSESNNFLLKRTGQSSEKAANALAQDLGDLPLGLEQAGAYISKSGITIQRYLEMFQKYRKRILEKGEPIAYSATVATNWEISFQRIQEDSPAGAELLNLCAYLAPDGIPRSLLVKGAQNLPKTLASAVEDELEFDDAISSLRSYSLISMVEGLDAFFVHRLVQAVTQDRLTKECQRKYAEAAIKLVNSSFSFREDNIESWETSKRLLPQLLVSIKNANMLEVAPEESSRLLNEAGLYLRLRGEFVESKSVFERALEIDKDVHGLINLDVARDFNHLGLVQRDQGDLIGAKKSFEKAHEINEKLLGSEHSRVATDLNNLGLVIKDLGELDKAKRCYEKALKIDEKKLSPDYSAEAIRVNNFGLVLKDLGDLSGARKCFEQALKVDEKIYGPNHPQVAKNLNNLGSVLEGLFDLEGAKNCFNRALKINEDTYGSNHPEVATTINNLGNLLRQMGELDCARECLERALRIDEAIYGLDHPNVARDVNNLGLVQKRLRDFNSARKSFERALEIDKKVYGSEHPMVANKFDNLGSLLQDIDELNEARRCFTKALEIGEKVFGPAHPDVAIYANNLGGVLKVLGDLQGAKKNYERALEIFREFLGDSHPNTRIVKANLDSLSAKISTG